MNILQISHLIFNFCAFYMCLTRGFIFGKTVVYTGMVWYVIHASVQAVSNTATYKTAYTFTLETTIPYHVADHF